MNENCCTNEKQTGDKKLGLETSDWIYLGIIWTIALLLRWIGLDDRPVHHDESLHLMYGRYFFDWPDQQFYKYDPMLHGPFLYNALRAVYDTLGSSTWSGRAFTAFLGSLFMFVPLYFRKYFSKTAFLVLCTAIALSPSFIYWSRFIREDTPQLLLMAVTGIGIFYCRGASRVYLILISTALQFTEKENAYVCLALLIGYLIFEKLIITFFGSNEDKNEGSSLGKTFNYIGSYLPHVLMATFLAALTYCYFYSAGFRYPEGILDGLYRKSLAYWFDQHKVQRIVGPFLFHFFNLSWYETIFTVFTLLSLVVFYCKAGLKVGILGAVIFAVSFVIYLFEASRYATFGEFESAVPWKYLHLKLPVEIISLFIFLIHPVICTAVHLLRRERLLAFFGYYFWASYFTYSYLGEKVPWLSVYILFPGLVYLVLFFDRWVSGDFYRKLQELPLAILLRWTGVFLLILGLIYVLENPEKNQLAFSSNDSLVLISGALLIGFGYLLEFIKQNPAVRAGSLILSVCLIFTARHAYMTNFTHSGSEVEYFSQVHTNKKFHDFILDVRRRAEVPTDNGKKIKILAEGDSTWPATWYLVDLPEYKFSATTEERKDFDYLFVDYKQGSEVPEGFCAQVLPLRSWFVPEFDKVTLKKYLVYTFNRRPWNGTGSTYTTALVKNEKWQECERVIP